MSKIYGSITGLKTFLNSRAILPLHIFLGKLLFPGTHIFLKHRVREVS